MRRLYFYLSIFFMLIIFTGINIKALGIDSPLSMYSKDGTQQEKVIETVVNDDIVKKEYIKYYLVGEDKNYKYVKVHVDVVYEDNEGNEVAVAFVDSNFRYNTEYNQARCLSTSRGGISHNNSYCLSTFARTKNINPYEGESYCSIRLELNRRKIDFSRYTIFCDYLGNVKIS